MCDKKHEIMAATLAGMHANEIEGTTSVVQHKLGCVSDSYNQLLSNNNSRQADKRSEMSVELFIKQGIASRQLSNMAAMRTSHEITMSEMQCR